MIEAANYEKVKKIFSAALELAPDERPAFLNENCQDENLRREVESLLAARAEAGKFLDDVSAVKIVQSAINKNDKLIGQAIGKYTVRREIGRGGMGVVFLATRAAGDFQKKVAVKIIRRGASSDETLRRFRQERRILAALEHPNIARLIDGGATDDDMPYLIMEYVEGVPIDEFCRRNDLSTEEKLKLFQKICRAVAHAHRNLTIHRDLKASNILVTEDGEPKLLDFGIAKLFSNEPGETNEETQTNFRALTPEYASPEQFRGEKLTTATDVYSLGVILYELLTGNRPFTTSGKTYAEVLQMVSESKPTRPSAVQSSKFKVQSSKFESGGQKTKDKVKKTNPKLNSDLDNIVLKSLAKEPERRYLSVEQFSEDIERFLKGLPVAARADTFFYRAEKFVRRNRFGVSIAAAAFLLLITGITIIVYEYRAAEIERAKAERRAENLRKLSGSFAVELHGAILNLPGSLPARKLLLTRAVEQLDALAEESDGDPTLRDELAAAYYNLGELPAISIADAEQSYKKALAIYENLAAADSENVRYRTQLAKGYGKLADLQKVRGDLTGAISYLRKKAEILKTVAADLSPDESMEDLFDSYYDLAANTYTLGEARKSLESVNSAIEVSNELVRRAPENEDYKRLKFSLNSVTAADLAFLGNYQEAIEKLRESIKESGEQAAKHPNDVRFQYELWAFNRRLGVILEQNGEFEAAFDALQTALDLMENLRNESPDDTGYQRNTAYSNLTLAQFLLRRNKAEKAISFLRRARELSEKLIAADAERGESIQDLAEIYQGLGNALLALANRTEAINYFRQSSRFYEKILERDPQDAILRRNYAEFLKQFGGALSKGANSEERDQANSFLTRSLQIWQDLQSKNELSYADANQPEEAARILAQTEDVAAK